MPNERERICGTWQFDEYPTYDEWISWFDMDVARPDMGKLGVFHERHLPVWSAGNAYLKGARPWKHEKNAVVSDAEGLILELAGTEEHPVLRTNVFDYLTGSACGMIDSDVLGCAFEPEQRFESPDGSAITFNRDYSGSHRSLTVLPGPFATKEDAEKALW